MLVRRGAKTPRTFGKINLCVAALGAEPFLDELVSDSVAHHYDTPDPAQPGIRQKSEESKGAVFSRQNIAPNRERRIHERRQSIWSDYMHNRHVDVEQRTVTFQFRWQSYVDPRDCQSLRRSAPNRKLKSEAINDLTAGGRSNLPA